MFDGLALPTLRSTRPARMELDGLDPINSRSAGFWPLTEPGGTTVADISPFRRRGTAENAIERVVGRMGRAMRFTGGGSFADNVNLGPLGSFASAQNNLAIAAFVYPTNTAGQKTIFAHYDNFSEAGKLAKLLYINAGTLDWYFTKSDGGYQTTTGPAISANEWSFVAVSVSGPTSAPVVSLTVNTTTTTATMLAIGTPVATMVHRIGASTYSLTGADAGFVGDILGVRAWERPLAASERARLRADPWAGTFDPADRLFVAFRSPAVAPVTSTLTGTIPVTGAITGVSGVLGTIAGTIPVTGSIIAGGGPHGVTMRRGRYRVYRDVPVELRPAVDLAEGFAEAAVDRAVENALRRYRAMALTASVARRTVLVQELNTQIVAAVARAADADDEEALAALL